MRFYEFRFPSCLFPQQLQQYVSPGIEIFIKAFPVAQDSVFLRIQLAVEMLIDSIHLGKPAEHVHIRRKHVQQIALRSADFVHELFGNQNVDQIQAVLQPERD